MLKSVEHNSLASQLRSTIPLKKYAAEGKNVPLKKNWSECFYTFTERFEGLSHEVLDFEVRQDDVFVSTYMKSGTTWMQECTWLLLNNLNYEKSKGSPVMVRSPYLEYHCIADFVPSHVELLKITPSPRVIKSHLPPHLLPQQIWEKKPKIIYMARNVKDVIVSCYHFLLKLGFWNGNNLPDFVDDFLNNEILYTNFWSHLVDFWKMRHEPFIFFVTYEEMICDLESVLRRLSKFFGTPELSQEEMSELLRHLSFENMKGNKNTNLTYFFRDACPYVKEGFEFMRRGIVGCFKDELTPELIEKIDNWSAQHLAEHGLKEEDIFGGFCK